MNDTKKTIIFDFTEFKQFVESITEEDSTRCGDRVYIRYRLEDNGEIYETKEFLLDEKPFKNEKIDLKGVVEEK